MSNIKHARIHKGLTQEQVATKLNTSRAAVSMYETGKLEANYSVLIKLSNLYGVSIDYLLGNIDDSQTTSNSLTIIQAKELWLSSLHDFDRTLVESVLRLDEKHKYQVFGYIESMARA